MRIGWHRAAALIAVATLIAASAAARELPISSPPLAGMSDERLERIGGAIQAAIDDGEIAGAAAIIIRNGDVAWLEAFGMADREAARPMQTDDLFRIGSMTKAITATAVLMLYEEGRFLLDDPISHYLPELDREMEIVTEGGETLVAARQPITIRHLLTHTSGMSYGFVNDALNSHYESAGVSDGVGGDNGITLEENVRRLAGTPLLYEPGTRWSYSLSNDVLGRLIEVVSGQPLDEFLTERLFLPLDMLDTHFRVPATKLDRLSAVYRHDADGNLERVPDGVIRDGHITFGIDYPYDEDARLLSGGAGLTSTLRDYSRFLQMVLNGGTLDGRRILSRKTVELMTTNQTERLGVSRYQGRSWSLAFEVEDGPAATGLPGSPGLVRWDGFYNTYYWADPEEELVALLYTQHYPWGIELRHRFRVLMYQAIDD